MRSYFAGVNAIARLGEVKWIERCNEFAGPAPNYFKVVWKNLLSSTFFQDTVVVNEIWSPCLYWLVIFPKYLRWKCSAVSHSPIDWSIYTRTRARIWSTFEKLDQCTHTRLAWWYLFVEKNSYDSVAVTRSVGRESSVMGALLLN